MTGEYLVDGALSLCMHEAGHIFAARALGVAVKKIGITWWGPYIVRETGSPAANALISAAGPLTNFIIAAAAWHAMPTLGLTNFVLGWANMLPTPTSDGRRVMDGVSLAWNALTKTPTA